MSNSKKEKDLGAENKTVTSGLKVQTGIQLSLLVLLEYLALLSTSSF